MNNEKYIKRSPSELFAEMMMGYDWNEIIKLYNLLTTYKSTKEEIK